MKKKYFIIIILFSFLSIILVNFLYISGNLDYFKNKIPQTYKEKLKKTVFYFTYLEEKNKILTEYSNDLNLQNTVLENKFNTMAQQKNLANANIFPQTHFLKLNYISKDLTEIALKKKELYVGMEFVSPSYLEHLNNKLFITSKSGIIHQTLISNLKNKNLEFSKIDTNLDKNIEITDTLIIKERFYVVFHRKNKDCKNISVFFTDLKEENTNFQFTKYFEYGSPGNCNRAAFAGRISDYRFKGQEGVLLTSVSFEDQKKKFLDQFGYRLAHKFSDVIFINSQDEGYTRIATGFKNPQGLIVVNDDIIASDHGPRGGDEINNVKLGLHYGYPYSSYGENYNKSLTEDQKFDFFKTHADKGFEEPIFSWVPSIAPSQLIKIDENFSKKWGETILLSSLKGRSLLRLNFDKEYEKLITYERIRINKRIRDLIYIPSEKMIVLAEENNNGSLGIITN
jgi:hypothetical protein